MLALGDATLPDFDGIETISISNPSPELATRYLGAATGAIYLIRPDQHIVARWGKASPSDIFAASDAALGKLDPCP